MKNKYPRLLVVLSALILSIGSLWAERVTQEDAALVAANFLNAGDTTSQGAQAPGRNRPIRRVALAEEAQYYVYANADGEGWVIVAANDVVKPILAYSMEGVFNAAEQPSNVKVWLGGYNKQIKYAEENNLEATEEVVKAWKALRKAPPVTAMGTVVVGPLIKTTWDQDSPYWNSCPKSGSTTCYTGCVATAMAQVMNYWQWPETGTGSYSYTSKTNSLACSADFSSTTYDWANMVDHYTKYYSGSSQISVSSPTTAQKNAVATLMYHCGVAVAMDYGTSDQGGSSAYTIYPNASYTTTRCAAYALKNNFGYNSSTLKCYYRSGGYGYSSVSDATWLNLLKTELDAKRPIMYAGADNEGGHSFICDGYDDQNYFHFNWGWSGYCDGYYTVDNMVPGTGGSGSGNGSYNDEQDIIIGIQPPETGHKVVTNGTGCTITPSATNVKNGNALTATITPTDATYDFTSITVKLGSTTISSSKYSLTNSNKTLTIDGSAITGDSSNDLTITIVWTKNRYKYEMLGEDCSMPDDGVVAMNASLSLTITPASGYTLADAACWDVEMGGNKLTYGTGFTYNANTGAFYIASVTGDVAILAYGGKQVSWYANGSLYTTNMSISDKITLPDDPADCASGKVFVGWCTESNYSNATTAPTFAKTGDTYSVATYYAVYATPAAGNAPRRATMAESPSEGTYKIYAQVGNNKYYVAGGTSGKLSNTTNAADAAVYTFETVTGGIAIKSGNDYLGYGTSGTDFATKSEQYAWVFSTGTYGTWRVTSKSTTNRAIVYRAGSTNKFGPYATSNINGTEYYDIEIEQVGGSSGGGSYTDYSTACGTPVVCALTGIALNTSGATTTFTTGDAFSSTGLVVTASYSNCSSKTVTPNSISTPDMSTAGKKTITVSYTENGVTKEASYEITVSDPVTHTVTWSVQGNTSTATFADDAALVLPSNPEDCSGEGGKKFVGWTEHSTVDGSKPDDLFLVPGTKTVTANITYYAVYAAYSVGGGTPVTKTMSTFTAISGNVDSDENISYEAAKGNAGTAPVVNSDQIRIYQNGGTLTITANNSKTLSSVTIGSAMGTTISYSIDGGVASENQSLASNSTFTVDELDATSIVFTCKGTTSSTRLYLNYLSVTYSGGGGGTTYSDYSLECSAAVVCALTGIALNTSGATTTFTTGDTFSSTGLVVTASYSNCSSKTVTPNSISTPDMSTAGKRQLL